MVNLYLNNKFFVNLPHSENIFQDINKLLIEVVQDYYLIQNGHILREKELVACTPVHVIPRLRGGKGGFGSMLRAIGAQIEKTTNREACRDLSGRRLRDINEEKRLKKWILEQADREKEAAEKQKKKLEKLIQEPRHEFSDAQYDKERAEMVDKVHSAVEEGLKVAPEPLMTKGAKRKQEEAIKKKSMLWIDAELGSDISDSDEEGDTEGPEEKKKLKIA